MKRCTLLVAVALLLPSAAFAAPAKPPAGSIAKAITAGAYAAGFGFGVAAITKFKAHKDNPTQVHDAAAVAAAIASFSHGVVAGERAAGLTGGKARGLGSGGRNNNHRH